MLKYVLILLFVIVQQSDSRCTHVPAIRNIQCDSVDAVEKAGEQKEWTSILIKNFKDYGKKQRIKSTTFLNLQQVNSLHFNNSVNYIEDFAFAGLPLEYLFFDECDFPVIKKNWFRNSSIFFLDISNSKVTSLESNCLEAVAVEIVTISGNNISHIQANAFNGTFIKTLSLTENNIVFIGENAFGNMRNLEVLDLNDNFLTSINLKLLIGNTVSRLRDLSFKNNKVKHLNKNQFVSFSNIKILDISLNGLELIHDGAFNGLAYLIHLDLSFNNLETFPERALPYEGLPSLQELYLHNNRLNYFPRSFIRYFPNLSSLSIFGNPWQCACYNEIFNSIYHNNVTIVCTKRYLTGERPVCVVPETSSDMCLENIRIADDLYETYMKAVNSSKNYDKSCHYTGNIYL